MYRLRLMAALLRDQWKFRAGEFLIVVIEPGVYLDYLTHNKTKCLTEWKFLKSIFLIIRLSKLLYLQKIYILSYHSFPNY